MGASRSDDVMHGSASRIAPLTATRTSIVVRAPLKRAFQQWARVEELSKFITPLRNVRRIDECQFSYSWHANGDEYQGVLQILLQIPGRRIAWRALSNALMSGVVAFERHSEQETEVTLKIRSVFDLPNLSVKLEEYLGNFKQLVENEHATK